MRYFLRSGNVKELHSRQQYLYDVFRLYFVRGKDIGDFIVLESFPKTIENDISIIYGHNYEVRRLLSDYNEIFEYNKIYCITCRFKVNKRAIPLNSQLFFANQINGVLRLHIGSLYNFDFDISDAELNLYRKRKRSFRKTLAEEFREYYA